MCVVTRKFTQDLVLQLYAFWSLNVLLAPALSDPSWHLLRNVIPEEPLCNAESRHATDPKVTTASVNLPWC